MAQAEFIKIQSLATTGTLASLTRSVMIVTRETVSGYSADSETGLYKINDSDYDAFVAANPTQYGLINALRVTFAQVYAYSYVYILSSPTGVTSTELSNANKNPRDWSFITIADRYNGDGTGGAGSTDYFADLATIQTWGPRTYKKIVVHTYSVEESGGVITLPTELQLGGDIGSDGGFKTIVSNSQSQVATVGGSPVYAYDNIALALLSFVINGPALARSWGSLSDAHDFLGVYADDYSTTSRSTIENASLAQYNGAKDRAGSLFVYDTQMNDDVNPALTDQIEALTSGDYIEDYVYVYVHNALQAAGQTGVTNDDAGIQKVLGLVRRALTDCFDLGLILSQENGAPDFSVGALTAAQVTQLSSNWKVTGIWPSGTIYASIQRFSADHYLIINFTFS